MTTMPNNLRRAINFLTLEQEFWASLLFEMPMQEVENPPALIKDVGDDKSGHFTMATDGKRIFYSREFVEKLTVPVVVFALAHEVSHGMFLHLQRLYEHSLTTAGWTPKKDTHGRMVQRNPTLWNIAGDYVINLVLKEAGFTLWDNCLLDDKYKGMTTEQVYEDLCKQVDSGQMTLKSAAGQLSKTPCGWDMAEPGLEADPVAEAEEWKDRIVRAAAIAKSRGHLPASIEGLIKEYTEPVYPVWLLLEQYVTDVVRGVDDASWHCPHPFFMTQGIIMPGPYSEKVPHVSVWYDTSGSVSDEELAKFHRVGGDIIRNACPGLLTLGQCDADVHSFTEVHSSSDWLDEIKVTGRGGTSFKPPFEYLREHAIQPTLMIYLTDLCGDFPDNPPPFPVLWVSTTKDNAPFGTTIHMGDKE